MSNFSSYNNWEGFTINPIDFKDKRSGVRQYVTYMLSRTQSMFKYTNLPETIPARMFELYLQCNGNCVVSDVNGELYAFTGGFGGVPDAYYRPTIYTVANPYLNLTKMYKIDEDCILVKNDSMLIGLLPMFERYATMLVENELTIDITLVMSRLSALLSAQDDKTRASAELVLKRIYDGDFGVISESSLLDGIKSQPYASVGNGYIQNLIEVNQYFKGSWINDIGLQYNANTKRENLTKNETEMNSDYLLPLVDDMLRNRRESINLINEKYGTEITVELASSWRDEYNEELAIEENSVQTEDETIDIESNSTQDDSVQTEENNITIEPLLEVVDDIGNIVETVVTDELQDDTEIASKQEFTENIVDGVTELVADILEGGDDCAQITDVE
jgi:hypothetical protein